MSTKTIAVFTAAKPLYRLLRLSLFRFYSTATSTVASQPQFDYDYYDNKNRNMYGGEDDAGHNRVAAVPEEDSERSIPRRGLQLVFIGSPGAMKHVYAEKLSKLLELPHISIASLVRQELNPRSLIYSQIADAVNNGKLVPEDVILGLLSKRLEDGYYRAESGFILDGIPRSLTQARILDQLAEIDMVVNFKCTEFYFVKHHKDAECAWKEKLRVYAEQSNQLEDYYRKQEKLLDIKVGRAPLETWQGLLAALHLQHMTTSDASEKTYRD